MEGFGEKSYENLMAAVNNARETELYRVLYGLGIAGIGLANARMLCRHFFDELGKLREASPEELCSIDGIGKVLAESIAVYFRDPENNRRLDALLSELQIRKTATGEELGIAQTMQGRTVVITGSLRHYDNRKQLEEEIRAAGGKTAGSVSSKTSYLVNNDITSTSGKNKKAKELGIPILTEEDFLRILQGSPAEEAASEDDKAAAETTESSSAAEGIGTAGTDR